MTRLGIVPSGLPYDPTWLAHPDAFGLQPDLPLTPGQHFASAQGGEARDALHGAFSDAAPDAWGRRLLERAYGRRITEFTYLTLSDDQCRQGALRFLGPDGHVITAAAAPVSRLIDLAAITQLARAFEQGNKLAQNPRHSGKVWQFRRTQASGGCIAGFQHPAPAPLPRRHPGLPAPIGCSAKFRGET